MIIRKIQLNELERARKLQEEAAALHIPVPVMSWEFEVKDKYGNTIEKGIGKSNSFTRNALNALAWYVGCVAISSLSTSTFGDGIVSYKDTNGTIASVSNSRYSANVSLLCGTSSSAESLDSYATPASGLTSGSTSVSSSFNSTKRKLVTVISNTFYNGTASPINIVESGLRESTSGSPILMVRDVFDAVTVSVGATLNWTYVIEVSYPNP